MESGYPRRKHPRLKNKEIYAIPGTVAHIIIGTENRIGVFTECEIAKGICDIIRETANEKSNPLYAYCVMPDHVHMLVGASVSCGIIKFVRHVKGRFTSFCRRKRKKISLQRSFYDHVMRKDEDLLATAQYILANPVRGGIATQERDYPFSGSMVFNL
ncbi:MAG: transposase [Deltaproteobacteria bacterium]|nr:transposase [Deltaproteobacteria bacterium]